MKDDFMKMTLTKSSITQKLLETVHENLEVLLCDLLDLILFTPCGALGLNSAPPPPPVLGCLLGPLPGQIDGF